MWNVYFPKESISRKFNYLKKTIIFTLFNILKEFKEQSEAHKMVEKFYRLIENRKDSFDIVIKLV